ncbi:MAG: TAXI family TRAP transporter solute-binding subunit [Alphaproteobacteria bacterium]|nr:TAXI family TRAP transporter solute-binding subunit [Alphaproteobacteria bacterium]MBU0798024.1 TAXI family TRAP transporter solute-binding subunit [Alphaproteobacteria bacterium]MBU0887564.1 TAXI family TRAP transporter solute-binding subunit [Alphaproteobacteria bacterium]MBU1814215.1 TAXI family TRAP transporter solute-binding subunit [Alphaproteobacteria bacterium]MBU2089536.1 TAXI family TRAP transporter solute-binding subunit [Alphaproteobacteria bacterium]
MRFIGGRMAATLAAVTMTIVGTAQGQAEPVRIILGTSTQGGGFSLYGDALAEAINAVEPGLSVISRATRGTGENLPLLEEGKLDIALVQGTAAYEALAGIGRVKADLHILTAMYSSPGVFAVRGDVPARSLDDLKGQSVVFGTEGSGLVVMADYILDGLGLDMRRDFKPIFVTRAADSPPKVIGGEAVALWGAGVGWPGFVRVSEGPQGARFIGLTEAQRDTVRARHSFLKPMQLPAGSYPGQSEAVETVGSWNFVLTRADLPEETAYLLIRAIDRAGPSLTAKLDQAAETTPAHTAEAAPERAMLHPGVERYLVERGLLK